MSFEDVKKENAMASAETSAAEQERRIRQFLAESLPPTEERIQEPMNPQCEVCVVLPAYSERNYILRPIASLAKQKGVNVDQFELIVVVNNPPSAPKREQFQREYDYTGRIELYNQGVVDNQETLKLIRYIQGEDVSVTLTDEEKEIITAVQESGLRVFAIDKASDGKTLPETEANVGGARNRGVAEAVARFHDYAHRNGIIAQSDAEIRFSESYIADLINIFKEKPELVGITGRVDAESSPGDYRLFKKFFSYSEAHELYTALAEHLFSEEKVEKVMSPGVNIPNLYDSEIPSFDGSNMASRAFEAALANGVPKLPGGEDPGFGFRLAKIGKTEKVPTLKTITLRRFSPRTTTGRGQINLEISDDLKRHGGFLVKSLEEIEFLRKFRSEFIKAIDAHQATPEHLRMLFRVRNQPLLDEEQLHVISQKIESLRGMKGNEMILTLAVGDEDTVELFKIVRARITEIMGPVLFENAVPKLIGIFCANAHLKTKYESIKQQMIEEENALTKQRREMLQSLLNIIFENKPAGLNSSMLTNIIKSHKEKIGVSDEDIANLEEQEVILNIIVEAIKEAETKQQAIDTIMIALEDSFSPPAEKSLRLQTIELISMLDALEERPAEDEFLKERLEEFLSTFNGNKEKINRLTTLVNKSLDDEVLRGIGLSLTVQEISDRLKTCVVMKNQDEFLRSISDILSPIVYAMENHPELATKIREKADKAFRDFGFTSINEALSYGIGGNNLHIHITDISKLGPNRKVASINDGMEKLAVIVQNNPRIRTISATSWLVAKHQKLVERLGFKIEGPISEEMRQRHFRGEDRPISSAVMSREEFLAKYLKE